MKPRYKHDGDSCCTFLGHYKQYDLYFCRQGKKDDTLRTVTARYGNEGWEYESGWTPPGVGSPQILEAKRLACLRKLTAKEPPHLDVYDSLLVRAIRCNKNRSMNMLKRVWGFRCNIELKYVEKEYITFHLLEIINDLNLISIPDFACKMQPNQYEFHHNMDESIKGYEYNNNLLNVCCSIIRLCSVEKLVGLRVPTRFTRNKK